MNLFSQILSAIRTLGNNIFNAIFGDVDFTVLWNWLPNDIQAACSALIIILFILAIFRFIKSVVPF